MPHTYIYKRIRDVLGKTQRFVKYRVFHVDDTPHRIALSLGIAFFVTWTPTIGLQIALVLLLCTVLGANKLVGLPFVWLSNAFTIIPIYYPSYRLGVRLIPSAQAVALSDWRAMVSRVMSGELGLWDRAMVFWRFALEIAGPLWLGSLLMALAIGGAMYWLSYVFIVRYRRRFTSVRPLMGLAAGQQTPCNERRVG